MAICLVQAVLFYYNQCHFLKVCNGLHSLEEIKEFACLSRTMSGLPLGVEDHYYGLRSWIKVPGYVSCKLMNVEGFPLIMSTLDGYSSIKGPKSK